MKNKTTALCAGIIVLAMAMATVSVRADTPPVCQGMSNMVEDGSNLDLLWPLFLDWLNSSGYADEWAAFLEERFDQWTDTGNHAGVVALLAEILGVDIEGDLPPGFQDLPDGVAPPGEPMGELPPGYQDLPDGVAPGGHVEGDLPPGYQDLPDGVAPPGEPMGELPPGYQDLPDSDEGGPGE